MARYFPPLLDLVEKRGPVGLVEAAIRWRARTVADVEQALRAFWGGEKGEPAERFFAKAILTPYSLARRRGWHEEPSRGVEPANV